MIERGLDNTLCGVSIWRDATRPQGLRQYLAMRP
jgi:hypothetical protein